MPNFEEQFCIMLETEFLAIRKAIDFILVYPEQMAEKIRSYCFRVANILCRAIINEIEFFRDQILRLKDIITNSKFFKNTRRICADMLGCMKIFELVANKPAFGNKSVEELKANADIFQKYVCDGKLLEAAQALLDTAKGVVEGYILAVRSAIDVWVGTRLNMLIAKYNTLLAFYDIPSKLENLDSWANCIFGVCDIGATVINYKDDITNRLYLTRNGQVDRSRFNQILYGKLNKITDGLEKLESEASQAQDDWHKIIKDKIAL